MSIFRQRIGGSCYTASHDEVQAMQGVLGDAVFTGEVDHGPARLVLLQDLDDLLFGVALALHIGASSSIR